jgi:hypothetical protein
MKTRGRLVIALAASMTASMAAPAWADGLLLTIKDGRVTLVADNVPIRQILDEWAKIGDTMIVNAEKLVGPPVTLRLEDVPERDALDIVLRTAAGYLVAPRPAGVPGASEFDRVLILASSRAPTSQGRSAIAPPAFSPPPVGVEGGENDPEDPYGSDAPTPPQLLPYPGPFPGSGVQPQEQEGQPQQPMTSPQPGFLPTPQQPTNPAGFTLPPGYPAGGGAPVPPRKPGGGGRH